MKKIFLLDDNTEMIEIAEMVLGKDYELYSKKDTANVTEELKDFEPDLILIDHFIGDSNSTEVLTEIKNAIPGFSVPFILFSAAHDISARAHSLGASGYIEKPSSINYIKSYIREFFENN